MAKKATGKDKASSPVEEMIQKKADTSCLGPGAVKTMQLAPADKVEMASLNLPCHVPAMEIPYFDLEGKPTGFKRWRYLADSRSNFDKLAGKKERRYVQAPDTACGLYMPPFADWKSIAKDPSKLIVFTEGELKAACCTAIAHFPCLGLGGVYSFKSVKRSQPLIPAFSLFDWNNRKTIVAFDSDAGQNPMVVSARNELCRVLVGLGARVFVADVPCCEDGGKQGIDDLCLASGADALKAVLQAAEPYDLSAALHDLNEEVAYVRSPGIVVTLGEGLKMRASDFTSHAYANRFYYEATLDAKGKEKMIKKPAAKAWIEWPLRLELKKMTFEPGQEQITEDGCFNTWPGWGCEPVEGDISPWVELLDHIFGDDKASRKWFEQWCAIPLQRPGCKMFSAAVFWSPETGTGKTSVFYALKGIYGQGFTEIGDKQLEDARNQWAIEKQLVLGDDVTGKDQRKYADRLKAMITQSEMWLDPKYVPAYPIPDKVNYGFTSNHPDAFFIEDDDRRFFVWQAPSAKLSAAFWTRFYKWMQNSGPSHLFHHLLMLDLEGRQPEDKAPDTGAKQEMVEDGLSDLGRWVRKLRDEPELVLKLGEVKLEGDLWASSDLLPLYDPDQKGKVTIGGLGKELKRAGFRQVYGGMPLVTTNGQLRLFAIRDPADWIDAPHQALLEHYNSTRGSTRKPKKF